MENAKDVAELLAIGMDYNKHGDKNVAVGQDAIRCLQVCLSLFRMLSMDYDEAIAKI